MFSRKLKILSALLLLTVVSSKVFALEEYVSDSPLPPCSYTEEEMMAICDQRMEALLSGKATTIPHEEVMRRIREKYGFVV